MRERKEWKGVWDLKQFIVMSAMVLLGIFIAGMVFTFRDSAENLTDSTIGAIEEIQASVDGFTLP